MNPIHALTTWIASTFETPHPPAKPKDDKRVRFVTHKDGECSRCQTKGSITARPPRQTTFFETTGKEVFYGVELTSRHATQGAMLDAIDKQTNRGGYKKIILGRGDANVYFDNFEEAFTFFDKWGL